MPMKTPPNTPEFNRFDLLKENLILTRTSEILAEKLAKSILANPEGWPAIQNAAHAQAAEELAERDGEFSTQ